MSVDWQSPTAATRVRDLFKRVAEDVVDGKVMYRTATVLSLAATSMDVEFADEPGNPVTIALSALRPKSVGQTVEIMVRNRTEFSLWRIYGDTLLVGETTLDPTNPPGVPTGLAVTPSYRSITASWDVLPGVDTYDVEWAKDSGFTVEPSQQNVYANVYSVLELTPGDTWFFRVRALNSVGPGTWSDPVSAVVGSASDGIEPANSPAVTITEGLRQLTATWPVQLNEDPVTYEVHISTATGFAPGPATYLGETSGTFWITTVDAAGATLVPGTTYFMRVVAKDRDGAAVPGGQDSGTPQDISQVVHYSTIQGDGSVPGTPAAPVVSSGIGYLYAAWTRPASPDPLQYQVHVSDAGAGFVPDANTLSLVTGSLFGFIRRQGPGAGGADLVYGTTYYVKIIAVDVDGVSTPSSAGSGFTVKANTADIAVNAITAASGIIADLAIGTAKIADAAITTAKINDLAVGTAKIADGAILTAKIGDAQILTAKIADAQILTAKIADGNITNAKIASLQASKITTDTLTATLTVSGSIRTSAGTARVEMNSGGLYAYDSGGGTVFSINSVGTAYFQGNIYAVNGTFTGTISSSATITGGTFQTATSGQRLVISAGTVDKITWYNSDNSEAGRVIGASAGSYSYINVFGGNGVVIGADAASGIVQIGTTGFSRSVYIYAGASGSITFNMNPRYNSYDMIHTGNISAYVPVSSVNGYTGAVSLNYTHVGAAASGHNHAGTYLTGGGSEQPTFAYVYASAYYAGTSGNYISAYTATSLRVGSGGGERYLSLSVVGVGQTKTFVIDHPKDKNKYLVHSVIEGPTADVFYRGVSQLQPDGGYMEDVGAVRVARVEITLPPYFEDLTQVEGRTVQVTPLVGLCGKSGCKEYLAPAMGASPIKDGKFTVFALAGFTHDCAKFSWEVKAIRKDVPQFEVEPSKKDFTLKGDGPYKYLAKV